MERLPNSYYRIPPISVESYEFTDRERNLFTKRFAIKNSIVALEKTDKMLTVCMGKPTEELYNKIKEQNKGFHIAVAKCCPKKLLEVLETLY